MCRLASKDNRQKTADTDKSAWTCRSPDVRNLLPILASEQSDLCRVGIPNSPGCSHVVSYAVASEQASDVYCPSTSLLRSLKKSASHSSGFSGSYIARCFIPSSKCGVMLELRYCLVGPPCATGFSGRVDG
ncbi:hypothetical protein KC320_g284 [Hortaea werneckii]|nr:hypothetical protein KC320_g284 [Hortaea werneckii]